VVDDVDGVTKRMAFEEKVRLTNIAVKKANQTRSEECVDCGATISSKRQDATGGTEYCVGCQSSNEIKSNERFRR